MRLYYDTETTGLPDWRAPSDAEHQPHLVQVAAVLLDDDDTERAAINLIVRPDGWIIPEDVAAIHGITTDVAVSCGVPEALATRTLVSLWKVATVRIGHNESFDARIIRIAMKRAGGSVAEMADTWKAGEAVCTCNMATPILNLPPTERMIAAGFGNKPKKANLSEAYQHFMGAPLVGAHDAMADVRACMAIHRAMTVPTGETAS